MSRRKARRNPPIAVLFNPGGKVLSREVHSLAYRHDDDGKAYRHDFEGPVKAQLNGDGSVTLRAPKGRKLWQDFPERPYLVNPNGKESRMARRTKRSSTRARRGKRPPPKGYRSWKDYMAAIRPGAAKPKRARTQKEAPMARKKHTKSRARKHRARGRAVVVHHSAARKVASHRRRYRRNPPGGRIVGSILQAGVDAVQVVGGEVLARGIPGALGVDLTDAQGNATAMGLGAQAAVAVALAVGLDFVKPGLGRMAAAGALAAPIRSVVKGAQLPWVSDQLSGNDGFYFGSYPSLSDYPRLVDADTDLGSYPTAQLQMQA